MTTEHTKTSSLIHHSSLPPPQPGNSKSLTVFRKGVSRRVQVWIIIYWTKQNVIRRNRLREENGGHAPHFHHPALAPGHTREPSTEATLQQTTLNKSRICRAHPHNRTCRPAVQEVYSRRLGDDCCLTPGKTWTQVAKGPPQENFHKQSWNTGALAWLRWIPGCSPGEPLV